MTHIVTSNTSSLQDDSREGMFYQEAEMSQPVSLQPNNDLNDPTNLVDLENYDMVDMTELAEEDPVNEHDFSTDDEDEEDEYQSISTEEYGDDFEDEEDDVFYLSHIRVCFCYYNESFDIELFFICTLIYCVLL
ncbi:hypothetical protein LIER_16587 [Lithospermum erythrorhizon]|uniref:Uncharacterized protein n=1 Tax=Lithospermum erythrorhizon TaxID=34254 RepID=A0AAV3QCM3_LITER